MSWAGPRGCKADVIRLIPLNETRSARHTPTLSAQPMGARGGEIREEGREEGPGQGKARAEREEEEEEGKLGGVVREGWGLWARGDICNFLLKKIWSL